MDTTSETPELIGFRAEMEAATSSCTYLDHAAVSPLPRPVREAMARYVDRRRAAFGFREEFTEVAARLREAIARLIGADPEEIGFV